MRRRTTVHISQINSTWLARDWAGNIAVIPPHPTRQFDRRDWTWWLYDGDSNWPQEVHEAVRVLKASL